MHRLNPNGAIPQTLKGTLALGRRRSGIRALETGTWPTEGSVGVAEGSASVLEETETNAGCRHFGVVLYEGGVLEEGKIKDVGVVGLYGTRKIEWRWGRCE